MRNSSSTLAVADSAHFSGALRIAPVPEEPWPSANAFTSVSDRGQRTDGSARCLRFAIGNDEEIRPVRLRQGDRAHFYFEFEALQDLEVPSGGVEITDARGIVVFGRNTFQTGTPLPLAVQAGGILRFHHWLDLDLEEGVYQVGFGLADTDPASLREYADGSMPYPEFAACCRERCRVIYATTLHIEARADGKLPFHGLTNLPGGGTVRLARRGDDVPRRSLLQSVQCDSAPTIFHVTHWKAGSQWIHKILRACAPEQIVEPCANQAQVRYHVLQSGHVYPTVYLSKPDMARIQLPPRSKLFVVIRDLRDTLVSAYFSFKISHPILDDTNVRVRQKLQELDVEAGMLYLMNGFLSECAAIQISWLESDALVLRYEDLLTRDVELLSRTLIDHCGLQISRARLQEIVEAHRFEALTGGRAAGREDVLAHERKGIAGDWRNHFTERLKQAFKARFGGLLVAAGYESSLRW